MSVSYGVEAPSRPRPSRRPWQQRLGVAVSMLVTGVYDGALWSRRHGGWLLRGVNVLGALWRRWQSCAERAEEHAADKTLASKQGLMLPAAALKRGEHIERDRKWRARLTVATVVVLATSALVTALVWPVWALVGWSAAAAGLVVLCDRLGKAYRPPDRIAPTVILGPTVKESHLREAITDRLTTMKPPVHGVTFHGSRWSQHLVELDVCSRADELDDRHLEGLARWVGAIDRGVTMGRHRSDAGLRTLTMRWADPLAGFVPLPRLDPGATGPEDPVAMGPDEWGREVGLSLSGGMVLVDGVTGSGKTGLVSVLLAGLIVKRCTRVIGIERGDGGAELGAARPALYDYATDDDHIERVLDQALAEIDRRIARLNRAAQAAHESGSPIERVHVPTEAEPSIWLVIVEYPELARLGALREKVNRARRKGRKARVQVLVETQDPTRDVMVDTGITSGATVRIGLSMPGNHIRHVFGDGAAADGFRPDLLEPSEGEGQVNDAGKFYARSGGSRVARKARTYGLSLDELAELARDCAAFAAEQALTAEQVELPEVLALLDAGLGDAERVSSASVVSGTGWTQSQLAAALRPYGIRPGQWRGAAGTERGYTRADLREAVSRL